jgi:hypothetical protein
VCALQVFFACGISPASTDEQIATPRPTRARAYLGEHAPTNGITDQGHTTNPPRSGRAPRKYITIDIIVIFSFDIAEGGINESTNDKTDQAHTTNPPRSGRAPRKYIFRGAFPRKIYIKNNSFARGPNASLYPNPSPRAATKRLHLKGEIGTPASPHAVIAGEMPHAKKNLQGAHCC